MADALILPLGIVTVSLVALRLGVMTAASLRQLKHQREHDQLALQLLRVRIGEAKKRRDENTLAWNGYRKFVIHQQVEEADGICSFCLKPHDGKPLPSFRPGQYLTFRLNIPGREKPVVRCYSLSDRPRPDQYRVTIKRVRTPRAAPSAPPGLVSNFFHEQLHEGEILDVQAPRGQFFLDVEQERPCVLIAGGVGVTPLLSMISTIAEARSGREILFFYGVRDGGEHAFREVFERTIEHHSNIRMVVAYSQPTPEDEKREGQDYHHAGRIDIDLIKSYLQSTNYEFYICGPPAMMETLNQQLLKWGVAKKDIKTEAFGPATVSRAFMKPKPAASTQAPAAASVSITFSKSGKQCGWEKDGTNLLDLALANGVQIESGCRAGNCGTCAVAIKTGKVTYLTEHGAELEEGTCLTCIAAPDGDVVLDA
ncbi:MAG: hypothetical protein CMJ64_03240 [Planctomycetaceae bacterium]|nr:hypothetical protein [Planctomycetaceae bacterium]